MRYHFDAFELDTDRIQLTNAGQIVAVEPQVFSLLIFLIEHRDQVVTRDQIIDAVWDGRFVSDAAVSSRIKSARQALGDDGRNQRFIKTVHGRGFRFVGTLSASETGATEPDTAPALPAAIPNTNSTNTIVGAKRGAPPSILVLPFNDLSAEQDQAHFASGMTEEILNALTKIPSLRVAGRASSFAYRDRDLGVREIGCALGVTHVLEGSVRRSADRVKVAANLSAVSDGLQTWSDQYDRTIEEVFDLQELIATEIASALQIVLELDGPKRLAKKLTSNPDAYDLFLRGRALVDLRSGETTLSKAVKLLETAVELDPNFAAAWAELARANNTLPQYIYTDDGDEYLNRAQYAAKMAIERDPELGRAYLAGSGIDSRRFGLLRTHSKLMRAQQLDPIDPDTLGALSYFWTIIGHTQTAIEVGEAARQRDPLNSTNLWVLGLAYTNAGQFELALELFQKSFDLGFETSAMWMPHVLGLLGRKEEAKGLMELVTHRLDVFVKRRAGLDQFSKTLARAVHGDDVHAKRIMSRALDQYFKKSGRLRISATGLAVVWCLGDLERFMDLYQRFTYSGDTFSMSCFWDDGPVALQLRAHPQFARFAEKVGLQAVWDALGPPDHAVAAKRIGAAAV